MSHPVLDVIHRRRSTRKFHPNPVPKDLLEQVLDAALWAPSACNEQPWYFTAMISSKRIAQLDADSRSAMAHAPIDWVADLGKNENYRVFYGAPAVVVVSGRDDMPCPAAIDCAIATQNLVLAAEALGLSSCWIGLTHWYFQMEKSLRDLEIPEGYTPLFAIALGFRDGPETPGPARKGYPVTILQE